MNGYKSLCLTGIFLYIILFVCVNIIINYSDNSAKGLYRVETKRLGDEIADGKAYDLEKYPHITGVYTADEKELYETKEHYLILNIKNTLYRVEYKLDDDTNLKVIINIILVIIFLLLCGVFFYIYTEIIKPFSRLDNVSRELAKGNLSVPIPEQKSRYFGSFIWGINLLRESIEDSRRKEIALKRDKKLLLLSLSHDINTPLSAIKLSAKALSKNLYKDDNKARLVAESINTRADEIERFVREITDASDNDLMGFEVVSDEVFLSHIISSVDERYGLQLAEADVEFKIQKYDDILLICDENRLTECMYNLMENAIKYGDKRHIGINFDRIDGCELITVYNSGCTLKSNELTQIYESFHRGSNSGRVQGNGMGLYICRKLMLLMDGDIYADIIDDYFYITLVVRLA